MQPAADRLAEDLEGLDFAPPRKPVWSNVTAELHPGDPVGIKASLVRQVVEPVRWQQTMEKLVGEGNSFIELAPGRVLAGLLKRVDRRAEIINLGTAESLGS